MDCRNWGKRSLLHFTTEILYVAAFYLASGYFTLLNRKEAMEQTKTQPVNWRQWMTYPHLVQPATIEAMDMLAEMLAGLSWPEERRTAMDTFLRTAKEEGLVTAQEYMRLRSTLASEM